MDPQNGQDATRSDRKSGRLGEVRDLLSAVARALADCVTFEDFFLAVRGTLTPYIPNDVMGIYLYEERSGTFRPLIHQADAPLPEEAQQVFHLPPENTLKARVIREKRAFHTPDLSQADYAEAPYLRRMGFGSHLVAPLIGRGRPRGVLYAVHRQAGVWDDFHLALFRELAAPVSVGLEEVRELERGRILQQCAEDISATLDIPEIFRRVSTRLQAVLPHAVTCIFRVDPQTGEMTAEPLARSGPEGLEVDGSLCGRGPDSLAGRVLANGEPFLAGDLREHEGRSSDAAVMVAKGIRSAMAFRLEVAGRPYGVFFMGDTAVCSYGRRDLESFLWIGRQLGLALSNSQAFQEVERLTVQLREENIYLKEEITSQRGLSEIVGVSPAMQRVLEQVEMVAATEATVLVTGETGTGKELIARAIHQLGPRAEKAMIRVNCAALPRELIESELFGHERGAFTGAGRRHIGRFELADGGTLFLDEVGDMSLEAQARLLRALQEGEFERVGGEKPVRVDVRVVAATNQDLARAVEEGRFRQDLFYRLQVFPLQIPPLRERPEDILPLARHFALRAAGRLKKPVRRLSLASQREMLRYAWPGNVRELEHMVERAVILARTDVLDLVPLLRSDTRHPPPSRTFPTLAEAERMHILAALEEAGGRLAGPGGAAEILGIPRTTLQARMRKLGIAKPAGK